MFGMPASTRFEERYLDSLLNTLNEAEICFANIDVISCVGIHSGNVTPSIVCIHHGIRA